MRTALELLAEFDVASPCSANWHEMHGDERVRFCEHCSKNVYNLSAITADVALDLIRAHEDGFCGRFYRRADGTALTADCPVGLHHRVPSRRRWSVLAASFAGLIGLTGAADSGTTKGSTSDPPAKVQRVLPLEPVKIHHAELVMGRFVPREVKKPLTPTPELLPMPRVAAPESESTPG